MCYQREIDQNRDDPHPSIFNNVVWDGERRNGRSYPCKAHHHGVSPSMITMVDPRKVQAPTTEAKSSKKDENPPRGPSTCRPPPKINSRKGTFPKPRYGMEMQQKGKKRGAGPLFMQDTDLYITYQTWRTSWNSPCTYTPHNKCRSQGEAERKCKEKHRRQTHGRKQRKEAEKKAKRN